MRRARTAVLALAMVAGMAWVSVSCAAVELSRQGRPAQRLNEVYLHEGTVYLAIDDVLPALGMSGYWDAVEHRYWLNTPRGKATFFPGSQYLKVGESFAALKHPPRFIDSRLRVSEDFVLETLADLLPTPIYYRNLNPALQNGDATDGLLERLFAFLLQKKKTVTEPALRAVAIDPGHGGEDPGTIGISGIKEKTVVLAVAEKLETQIKMQLGIPVYLSRDDDYALTATQHLDSARHEQVDAFLLLHAQASLDAGMRGIHLYVRPAENEVSDQNYVGGRSMTLALNLSEALRSAGFEVVEVAQAPLLPLVRGNLPTVLIELGYLSNLGDQTRLSQDSGQQRLVAALLAGLKAFGAAP